MCAIFVPAIPLFPAAWFAGHPSRCRTCTPVAHPGKPCPLPIRPAGNAARPAGPAWPFDPFALLHPGSAAGRRSLFALVACCRSCRSAGPAPAAVVDPATLARWPAAGVAAQDHRPAVPLARWLHAAGAAAALALLLLPSSIRPRWPAGLLPELLPRITGPPSRWPAGCTLPELPQRWPCSCCRRRSGYAGPPRRWPWPPPWSAMAAALLALQRSRHAARHTSRRRSITQAGRPPHDATPTALLLS